MKDEFVKDFGKFCAKYKLNNVAKMQYEDDGINETVIITYTNNYKKRICVTLDSETAVIKDIIKQGGL